jgi:hypothetical protein
MGWWPDWLGYADYIHIMGYMDDYESHEEPLPGECYSAPQLEGNPDFFRYSWKVSWGVDSCGFDTNAISMGMPAWLGEWGDKGAQGHLQDLLNMKMTPGVCFWNLELPHSVWREAETWRLLKQFRDKRYATTGVRPRTNVRNGSVLKCSLRKKDIVVSTEAPGLYRVEMFTANGKRVTPEMSVVLPRGSSILNVDRVGLAGNVGLLRISGLGQTALMKMIY